MSIRIGINGFGRIGRSVARLVLDPNASREAELVAVNDPAADAETRPFRLEHDSVSGRFPLGVEHVAGDLRVGIVHVLRAGHDGQRARGQGPRLVRQRMGLRQPARRLEAEAKQHEHAIARLRQDLVEPNGGSESLDRALAALDMYLRREAFEVLHSAIQRIDEGRCGICVECGQSITLDQLEELPQATRCRMCTAPTATDA